MKSLVSFLFVFPLAVFAAKPAAKTPAGRSSAPEAKTVLQASDLVGLSVYGTWDMADNMDFDGAQGNQTFSGNFSSDKAFGFGAQYHLTTHESGIGLNVGGSYELGRQLSNYKIQGQTTTFQTKPEVQFWTFFGNADAYLTQKFAVFAGLNYNMPSVKNLKGSWKGKMGYQFGATYLATNKLAIDGMMRTLNWSGTVDENNANVSLDNVRNQGILVRGRYMF